MEERIEEVTIKKIYEKKFDKFNAKNLMVELDVEGNGQPEDVWLNGYEGKQNKDWKEGDVVRVKIFEQDRYNEKKGRNYLGYKVPESSDLLELRIDRIEKMVEGIYKMNKFIYQKIKQGDVGASMYSEPDEPFDLQKTMDSFNKPALADHKKSRPPSMENPPKPPPKKAKSSGDDLPPYVQEGPPIDAYE